MEEFERAAEIRDELKKIRSTLASSEEWYLWLNG